MGKISNIFNLLISIYLVYSEVGTPNLKRTPDYRDSTKASVHDRKFHGLLGTLHAKAKSLRYELRLRFLNSKDEKKNTSKKVLPRNETEFAIKTAIMNAI